MQCKILQELQQGMYPSLNSKGRIGWSRLLGRNVALNATLTRL